MNKIVIIILGILILGGIFGYVFYVDSQGKTEEPISAGVPKFAEKNNKERSIIEMRGERKRVGANPVAKAPSVGPLESAPKVLPRSPVRAYGVPGGGSSVEDTVRTENQLIPRSDWRYTAPYGRLLKCALMNTLQSIDLATPIIGVVTEDLIWDGEVIVPVGTEVHGRAINERSRERLGAAERWVLVMKEDKFNTRREMIVNGLVLDRSYDEDTDTFGPLDGSSGFKGKMVDAVDEKMIKLFAATFIQGLSSAFTETETNGIGTVQVVPSIKNGALGGTQALLGEVAQNIRAEIEREGYYTQVAGGTPFYIYIQEGVDREAAKEGISLSGANANSVFGSVEKDQ